MMAATSLTAESSPPEALPGAIPETINASIIPSFFL